MINKTITAGLICFMLFVSAFFLSGQSGIYFNATAFLVVVSGTLGAALMSYGPLAMKRAVLFASSSYREEPGRQKRLVDTLMSLGHLHRRHGVVSPASVQEIFPAASRGLEMIKDGYNEKEIREIMASEARANFQARQDLERVFRSMAVYSPSFGVAGSVIGLVGLLMGMDETSLILKSIPITLVSTLYGIVLANFLFLPVAEKIRQEAEKETREREMILCAMVGMTRGADFLRLQRMLNAMVSDPDSRVEDLGAFRRISSILKGQAA
ncbi:motility protein A [Desulfonatronovibrio hydrogenovorans]|uniref:motility protein A n=1 Tax=Desulfonatronovibrio hydrogenovorans TaxID=53245 RepID=UPI00048F1B0C|nr:MotA/TolQ/ExbB proton channel family protein [Desulfonatronovibrio hydrogenovorans]